MLRILITEAQVLLVLFVKKDAAEGLYYNYCDNFSQA